MTNRRQGRRCRPASGHADDWLMTYADMITLLLCFFAVFLIIALSKKTATLQPLPPPIVKNVEAPDNNRAPIFPPLPLPLPQEVQKIMGNLPFIDIEEAQEPLPAEPSPKTATAEFEQKGDRIFTYEENNAAFFERGNADLSERGRNILISMIDKLKENRFQDYQITVEGHTDDSPIRTVRFPSNWELSTARAAAVVRFFIDRGISAQRLRAAGYADTLPKVPNKDTNGAPLEENMAINRRVVIKLEKIEKERALRQ